MCILFRNIIKTPCFMEKYEHKRGLKLLVVAPCDSEGLDCEQLLDFSSEPSQSFPSSTAVGGITSFFLTGGSSGRSRRLHCDQEKSTFNNRLEVLQLNLSHPESAESHWLFWNLMPAQRSYDHSHCVTHQVSPGGIPSFDSRPMVPAEVLEQGPVFGTRTNLC